MNKQSLVEALLQADQTFNRACQGRSKAARNPIESEHPKSLSIIASWLGLGAIFLCSFNDVASAATSRCSEQATIEKVRDLEGANSPVMQVYESMGARIVFSLDAIRTVSSSENGSYCAARLTARFLKAGQQGGTPKTDENGNEKAEEISPARSMEVGYKVEVTDDGQNYVTLIPPAADVRQQEYRQEQRDQFLQDSQEQQRRLDEQMRKEENRAQGR